MRSGASCHRVTRGVARSPEQAAGWLVRAAREAASTSPAAAVSLLERAIALTAPTNPARDSLLAERAAGLLWAGRVSDAERACRALLSRAHDPGAEAAARLCLGHALLAGGRSREALQELEAAAELTDTGRADALGWAGLARMWSGDLDGAASVARRALSAATATDDPLATCIALGSLAAVTRSQGHLRDAGRLIDDAVRLADQTPGGEGHRYSWHALRWGILSDMDRLEEAAATLRAGRRICEELGVDRNLPSYQASSTVERFIAGEWDDAIAETEASVEIAQEMGVTHGLALSYGVLSLIKLHRNDIAGAQGAAETAAGHLTATGPGYRSRWALWARALALEADGRPGEAFAALAQVWDECAAIGLVIEYRELGPDLVRLALTNGDQRRARHVASAVARLAEENDVPSLSGVALRCQGLADSDPRALAAAVDAYTGVPRPLELAQACEDAGVVLARAASPDPARQFMERALEIYEALDAARDVLRAEATLRDLGVRRGRRGSRARSESGWDSLTPSERTIADLVAQGLSNPQVGERLYVSRRTVQTHLAHIFAKLDVSSRVQLAAEVARHQ